MMELARTVDVRDSYDGAELYGLIDVMELARTVDVRDAEEGVGHGARST